MTAQPVSPWQAHFEDQAQSCEGLGSPFTARLLRCLATRMRGGAVAARIARWPAASLRDDALALRLAGGLHALVLMERDAPLAAVYPPHPVGEEALWEALAPALLRHEAHLLHWLDSAPQTNEIRRSAGVMLATQHLAAAFPGLPFVLSELGASAGLNLQLDRYALRIGAALRGATDPVLTLAPDWTGPLPPEGAVAVAQARGVDLNPLDPGDPAAVLRLRSYLWPDQGDRMARLDAALAGAGALAGAEARVDQGDAAAWLAARLATPQPGRVHLVFHTIAWQYFPAATRDACGAALARAGRAATEAAPLARLAFEGDGARPGAPLTLTVWPGGETRPLGRMDYHGRWVQAV